MVVKDLGVILGGRSDAILCFVNLGVLLLTGGMKNAIEKNLVTTTSMHHTHVCKCYYAGKALSDVLSVLKSSGTSNADMYTSDPVVEREGRHRVLARQLIANYSGSATPECDALCRSRAVILEGIFVVSRFISLWSFQSSLIKVESNSVSSSSSIMDALFLLVY
jgi:hypothetical protein